LYRVYFDNHPDLRRILTNYGFEDHPTRKNFPLLGFAELHYDSSKKCIVVKLIGLTQKYVLFSFENLW